MVILQGAVVAHKLKIGLGSFVRPRGAMSPNAIGTVRTLDKEDGKDVLTAIAPHGEKMEGEVTTFEVVEQPRWHVGDFMGLRETESAVVIEMTREAKFRVMYGPKGKETTQWMTDLLDLSIAKHVGLALVRMLRNRYRQVK